MSGEGSQRLDLKYHKRPGFGSKRDALCGTIKSARAAAPAITPWDLNPAPHTPERALVLGAGLAGAHAAFALARRGVAVTVLEAASVAGGGSSNLQGVTYTRLSHQHNPLTDFSLAGFGFATDHYETLLSEGALTADEDIGLGGYVQLHEADDTLAHLSEVLPLAPAFAQVLSAAEIAALTGLTPRCGGIHYLRGGWLTPRRRSAARYWHHPLISLQGDCGPLSLSRGQDGGWQASMHRVVAGGGRHRHSGHGPRRAAATGARVAAAYCHSRADDTPADAAPAGTTLE